MKICSVVLGTVRKDIPIVTRVPVRILSVVRGAVRIRSIVTRIPVMIRSVVIKTVSKDMPYCYEGSSEDTLCGDRYCY